MRTVQIQWLNPVLLFFFIIISGTTIKVFAQDSTTWLFLKPFLSLTEKTPPVDPDAPIFRFYFAGAKAKAMAGMKNTLVGCRTGSLLCGINLGGFVEIHNYNTIETQYLPWELWRGSLSFELFIKLFRLLSSDRVSLLAQCAYYHESNHFSQNDYVYDFTYLTNAHKMHNASMSSNECFRTASTVFYRPTTSIDMQTTIGVRLFVPPINPGDRRNMGHSFLFEFAGIHELSKRFFWTAGIYGEILKHTFDWEENHYYGVKENKKLTFFLAEAGIGIKNQRGARFWPYVGWNRSNGRGLDFPRFYKEFVIGLKLMQ